MICSSEHPSVNTDLGELGIVLSSLSRSHVFGRRNQRKEDSIPQNHQLLRERVLVKCLATQFKTTSGGERRMNSVRPRIRPKGAEPGKTSIEDTKMHTVSIVGYEVNLDAHRRHSRAQNDRLSLWLPSHPCILKDRSRRHLNSPAWSAASPRSSFLPTFRASIPEQAAVILAMSLP